MDQKKVHDFEINQHTQKVFSKHKMDLSNVNFTARGGVLYVEGMITALGDDSPMSFSCKVMETVDMQLRLIQGVTRIRYNLLNMSRTEAGWRHIKFIKSEKKLVWKISGGGATSQQQPEE